MAAGYSSPVRRSRLGVWAVLLLAAVTAAPFLLSQTAAVNGVSSAPEAKPVLDDLVNAWHWSLYWKGAPEGYRAGSKVNALLFWNEAAEGMCIKELGVCLSYARSEQDHAVPTTYSVRRVPAVSSTAMFEQYLKYIAARGILVPSRMTATGQRPTTEPVLPELPSGVNQPASYATASVTFALPDLSPPDASLIATAGADQERSLSDLVDTVFDTYHTHHNCTVLVPYFSTADDEVYVGIECPGLKEVRTFLKWHTGEWRPAERYSKPADVETYMNRIQAGLWRRVQR